MKTKSFYARYLEKRGWKLQSSKYQGCMKIVRWRHPKYGTLLQHEAVILEQNNTWLAKIAAAHKGIWPK